LGLLQQLVMFRLCMWDPCPLPYPRLQRNNTLAGAMSEFVSAVQVVVELPPANCTMESRAVHYIIANHDTLNEALQSSLELRYLDFRARFSTFSALVGGAPLPPSLWILLVALGGL
jgi:hypothetical protein